MELELETTGMYFRMLIDLLLSPAGMVAILAFVMIAVLVVLLPVTRWIILGLVFWWSTFGIGLEVGFIIPENLRLIGPLHVLSLHSRELTMAGLFILLIPTIMAERKWRRHGVMGCALLFFLMHMWMVSRFAAAGGTFRAASNALGALLNISILAYGVGRWIQSPRNAHTFLKCVGFYAVLLTAGNVAQIIFNPASLHILRFAGTTANQQGTAQFLAIALPTVLVLIMKKYTARIWRLLLIVTAGCMVLFQIWTGSRVGMVMVVVGLSLLFRLRLHHLIVIAVLVGLFVWIGGNLIPESYSPAARFLDTTNSRAKVWASTWEHFQQNPLLGVPGTGSGYGESTLLSELSSFGLIGGVLCIAAAIFYILVILKLEYRKSALGDDSILVRLATCNMGMMCVSAIIESGFLGAINTMTLFFYFNTAFLGYLLDATAWGPAGEYSPYAANLQPQSEAYARATA